MQALLITGESSTYTKIQSRVQLSSHFLITMTLKCVLDVMLFLAEHNLSFHGHSCKISDPDSGFSWNIFECFRVA